MTTWHRRDIPAPRRQFLNQLGDGFGATALAAMLAGKSASAARKTFGRQRINGTGGQVSPSSDGEQCHPDFLSGRYESCGHVGLPTGTGTGSWNILRRGTWQANVRRSRRNVCEELLEISATRGMRSMAERSVSADEPTHGRHGVHPFDAE